jgi:hypothetical protein
MAIVDRFRIQAIDIVLHGKACPFLLQQLFLGAYLLDDPSRGLLLRFIR